MHNSENIEEQCNESPEGTSQEDTPDHSANSQDSESPALELKSPAVEVQIEYGTDNITDEDPTNNLIVEQDVETPKENGADNSDSDIEEIGGPNITETIDLVDESSSDIEIDVDIDDEHKSDNVTKTRDLVEEPSISIKIKQEPMDQNETETNLKPLISIQIKQEVIELEDRNVTENLDFNDESHLSVKVKDENDDECAVKKKMIEGMKNDNSLGEEEGGYEFILSSVFNTNSSNGDTEIAEEKDNFDDLISIPKKKVNKKAKKVPTQKKSPKKDTATNTTPIKTYKCSFTNCLFVAYDIDNLKNHLNGHKANLSKAIMTCSKCNNWFMTIPTYLAHLPEHGYMEWSCPDCLKGYVSCTSLMAHIKSKAQKSFKKLHEVDKVLDRIVVTYKCKVCDMVVDRKSVVNHWEKHLTYSPPDIVKVEIKEEEGYVDIYGDQDLPQANDEHVVERPAANMTQEVMEKVLGALVENTRRKGHKCCLACGRIFERRNDCKRHHIEHLLTNAYATKLMYKGLRCQLCRAVFERADAYKHHMRAHGHLPVYKCQLCFKTFSDSSNYVKHKKTHKAMFICDICNKKFIAKSSLIKHFQQCHKTTEPLNCEHCSRQFFTNSDLSRHTRSTHTKGQARFICPICRIRFTTLKDKWDHMWIQHKERLVKADCPICKAGFRKVSDVKKHLSNEHKMEVSVMTVKVYKDLMSKIKNGVEIDFVNELVTVKREEDKSYVLAKHGSQHRDFEVFNKNDLIKMMNDEMIKKEYEESL